MSLTTSRIVLRSTAVAAAALITLTGCNHKVDLSPKFKSAINDYYSTRPSCLWGTPTNFPKQADTSGSDKTSQLDSLVDQGLLARTTAEKKRFIIGSKQVNNYDLSDKGRSAWTADPQQPGYGNFCYGHRKVTSIDTPVAPVDENAQPTSATIQYRYAIDGVADWAKAGGVQTAFPDIRADLNGQQAASATLTNTSNGWQVASVPNTGSHPGATAADGQIVK